VWDLKHKTVTQPLNLDLRKHRGLGHEHSMAGGAES
jgi:hypothetical protein